MSVGLLKKYVYDRGGQLKCRLILIYEAVEKVFHAP